MAIGPPSAGGRAGRRTAAIDSRERVREVLYGRRALGSVDAFELDVLASQAKEQGQRYREFLRASSMSLGVYCLRTGEQDPQRPHGEDEAYLISRGHGSIRVGPEDRKVGPGSIVFVRAGVEHRFHDITEDLTILVFFAPAEGSSRHG